MAQFDYCAVEEKNRTSQNDAKYFHKDADGMEVRCGLDGKVGVMRGASSRARAWHSWHFGMEFGHSSQTPPWGGGFKRSAHSAVPNWRLGCLED